MTPETRTSTQVVTTSKKIEFVKVLEDVIAYRLTTTTTAGRRKAKTSVEEGITSLKGVSAFKNGSLKMPSYSKDWGALLGTPEFREFLRTNGWYGDDLYKRFEALSKTPYTRLLSGEASASDILFIEGSSHRVYDCEKQPLPCAMLFNYIDARMDNGSYDLNKALEILKVRSDIRFVAEDRWSEDLASVQRIPYYNVSRGKSYCLAFVWMPSVEDYCRMYAQCETYGEKYPSTTRYRAVFDLDLLGLRAGGAARHEGFYGEVADDSSSEYEDND